MSRGATLSRASYSVNTDENEDKDFSGVSAISLTASVRKKMGTEGFNFDQSGSKSTLKGTEAIINDQFPWKLIINNCLRPL